MRPPRDAASAVTRPALSFFCVEHSRTCARRSLQEAASPGNKWEHHVDTWGLMRSIMRESVRSLLSALLLCVFLFAVDVFLYRNDVYRPVQPQFRASACAARTLTAKEYSRVKL